LKKMCFSSSTNIGLHTRGHKHT